MGGRREEKGASASAIANSGSADASFRLGPYRPSVQYNFRLFGDAVSRNRSRAVSRQPTLRTNVCTFPSCCLLTKGGEWPIHPSSNGRTSEDVRPCVIVPEGQNGTRNGVCGFHLCQLDTGDGVPSVRPFLSEFEGTDAWTVNPRVVRVRTQSPSESEIIRCRALRGAVNGDLLLGFEREVRHLDGRAFTVGSPRLGGGNAAAGSEEGVEEEEEYRPPVIIQTGDVHVLRGEGMPKRGCEHGKRRTDRYGDLYVQYTVEMPSTGSSSISSGGRKQKSGSLTSEERDQLGRLLHNLEGRPATTTSHKKKSGGNGSGEEEEKEDKSSSVRYLSVSSARHFGHASGPFNPGGQSSTGDEHLHADDDPHGHQGFFPGGKGANGRSSFFQSFGGNGGRSGFQYFSSSGFGNMGNGGNPYEGKDEGGSNVECQQM